MAILKIWDGSAYVEVPILDGVPGGELGGTWPNPTVDPFHGGSVHYTDADAVAAVPFLFYIPLGNAEDGSPVTP